MRLLWPLLLSSILIACAGGSSSTSGDPDGAVDDGLGGEVSVQDVPVSIPDVSVSEVSPSDAAVDGGGASAQDVAGPDDASGDTSPWDGAGADVAEEDTEVVASPPDVQSVDASPVPAGASPGRAPMRRLTRHEIDNTARDLLGVDGVAALVLPPEPESQGFDNQVDVQTAGPGLVESLMLMAEQIAAQVVLADVLPCTPEASGETPCGHAFITHFGRRALRRPLSETQQTRYEALFDQALVSWGFEDAVRLVIVAMLQSPHYLYRVELGLPETATDGVVRPTPHEMAARLSFLLWESTPDEELVQVADAGELVTSASVTEQAERMLGELGAERMMDHFHREWLLLDRLLFMAPVSDKFASFRTETRLFVRRVLFEGAGTLQALLTDSESFADDVLSLVYGDPELGGGAYCWLPGSEFFEHATLDPEQRAGVLTQPSVLSVHSVGPSAAKTLIRRGAFVLDRLLCSPLPPPPDDVPVLPLDEETELSPPDLLAQHTSDPACQGCHGLIDPVGAAFEHYTAIGVWRDAYHDETPVDSATELIGTPLDGTYADAVDLAHALAESEVAATCYARHWYRFAHGRAVETDDVASFDQVLEAFQAADGDVMTLVRALVQTDAFLYRPMTQPAEEVEP